MPPDSSVTPASTALSKVDSPNSSGTVQAACRGPRLHSTTTSRIRLTAKASSAWSAISVRASASTSEARTRATSSATLPLPTMTARSADRSKTEPANSGWPLYQATNSVAAWLPGNCPSPTEQKEKLPPTNRPTASSRSHDGKRRAPKRRRYRPIADNRLRSPADQAKTAGRPRSHVLCVLPGNRTCDTGTSAAEMPSGAITISWNAGPRPGWCEHRHGSVLRPELRRPFSRAACAELSERVDRPRRDRHLSQHLVRRSAKPHPPSPIAQRAVPSLRNYWNPYDRSPVEHCRAGC